MMSPFDQAWALLKAPIVPNSVRNDKNDLYTALFEDPKSGERLPMRAEYRESVYNPQRDELHVQIGEGENRGIDSPLTGEAPARSHVGFKTAWGDEEEMEELEDSLNLDEDLPMMARQLTTEEPYQRRGYTRA